MTLEHLPADACSLGTPHPQHDPLPEATFPHIFLHFPPFSCICPDFSAFPPIPHFPPVFHCLLQMARRRHKHQAQGTISPQFPPFSLHFPPFPPHFPGFFSSVQCAGMQFTACAARKFDGWGQGNDPSPLFPRYISGHMLGHRLCKHSGKGSRVGGGGGVGTRRWGGGGESGVRHALQALACPRGTPVAPTPARAVLRENKKRVWERQHERTVTGSLSLLRGQDMGKIYTTVNNGWRLVAVGGWRLAVGGWWQLAVSRGALVVPRGCPQGLSRTKNSEFCRTDLTPAPRPRCSTLKTMRLRRNMWDPRVFMLTASTQGLVGSRKATRPPAAEGRGVRELHRGSPWVAVGLAVAVGAGVRVAVGTGVGVLLGRRVAVVVGRGVGVALAVRLPVRVGGAVGVGVWERRR